MPDDKQIFDPLHERTRKLAGPCYLNVSHEPVAGTDWIYFDGDNEGSVRWHINCINEDGSVTMTKRTGEQIGYRTDWPIAELNKSRWTPADETQATYLWACPECRAHRPILVGDYVCIDCREGLDTDA